MVLVVAEEEDSVEVAVVEDVVVDSVEVAVVVDAEVVSVEVVVVADVEVCTSNEYRIVFLWFSFSIPYDWQCSCNVVKSNFSAAT